MKDFASDCCSDGDYELGTSPRNWLCVDTICASQAAEGQLGVNLFIPNGPRVGLVGHVGNHDIACEAPKDGDDGIDDEQPPIREAMVREMNAKSKETKLASNRPNRFFHRDS